MWIASLINSAPQASLAFSQCSDVAVTDRTGDKDIDISSIDGAEQDEAAVSEIEGY